MKTNVLIIGSGKMAEAYLQVIKKFREFNIIGIYSRNQKKLKKFCETNKIVSFSNYRQIKKQNNNIDLIIIAVTAPNLISVIKKTKDLSGVRLIEKPLGISLKEAKFIKDISLYKKYFLALNRRTYESTKFTKKKIRKSKIIYVEDHINFEKINLLGFHKKNYKNFIFSHSIHLIDYFNIFSEGKIINIEKNKFKFKDKIYLYCILNFSSGEVGVYTCVYNSKKKWKVSIIDKNKTALFQPLENVIIKSKKNIIKFTPINYDKKFKPGIFNIIQNLNFYFKKQRFELVNMKEAYKIMKLINDIHF